MAGSLLKSSGWFLRPPHLKKTMENNPLPPPDISPPTPPERPFVPPEEELFIRKCCPVTLNHLLPDLYLTQKQHIDESSAEFETNMTLKLERHLEESHSEVSCSSSTENEEESEEEKNLEDCFENDINLHILQNNKLKFPNKHLLKPHIINYPGPDMKESSLSGITLNNEFCLPSNNQKFPSTLQCAKNVQRFSAEIVDFQHSDGDIRNIMVPFKNNRQIQPLVKSKEFSYTPTKRHRTMVDQRIAKQYNPFDSFHTSITPKTDPDVRSRDVSNQLKRHLPRYPQYSTPVHHTSTASLCVYHHYHHHHHRRAKSLPPFKTTMSSRTRSPVLPESLDNFIIPSPHLIQLARLKKEELELQEKMLLRQRQVLELERLRSPEDKWYEMKNCRFHQEAHKNTVFLKNENNLPLIRERRQQLYDVVMASQC